MLKGYVGSFSIRQNNNKSTSNCWNQKRLEPFHLFCKIGMVYLLLTQYNSTISQFLSPYCLIKIVLLFNSLRLIYTLQDVKIFALIVQVVWWKLCIFVLAWSQQTCSVYKLLAGCFYCQVLCDCSELCGRVYVEKWLNYTASILLQLLCWETAG